MKSEVRRRRYRDAGRSLASSCSASFASLTLPCSSGSALSHRRKKRLYATAAESRWPAASY